MYPGIELRLYRYVSVLAEELNFTQAAMRLHVSQPTLSTQIRDLEREIDVKLFERTRGGQQVALTASGEAFAAEARLALVHADRAVQEARNAHGQHSGTWKPGYSPLIDHCIVHKVRRYLCDAHTAADLQFCQQTHCRTHRRADAGAAAGRSRDSVCHRKPRYVRGLASGTPNPRIDTKAKYKKIKEVAERVGYSPSRFWHPIMLSAVYMKTA
jgi:hypothetical protein